MIHLLLHSVLNSHLPVRFCHQLTMAMPSGSDFHVGHAQAVSPGSITISMRASVPVHPVR